LMSFDGWIRPIRWIQPAQSSVALTAGIGWSVMERGTFRHAS
jgi:hypothetical protein